MPANGALRLTPSSLKYLIEPSAASLTNWETASRPKVASSSSGPTLTTNSPQSSWKLEGPRKRERKRMRQQPLGVSMYEGPFAAMASLQDAFFDKDIKGGPSYACWDVLPRKYGMSGSTLTFECGFTSVSTKQLSDTLAAEGAAGPAGKSLQSSAFVHAVLRLGRLTTVLTKHVAPGGKETSVAVGVVVQGCGASDTTVSALLVCSPGNSLRDSATTATPEAFHSAFLAAGWSSWDDLEQEVGSMPFTGTKVIIQELRQNDQGEEELDVASDPEDICRRKPDALSNLMPEEKTDVGIQRCNSHCVSFRNYVAIMYRTWPQGLTVLLRGTPVQPVDISSWMVGLVAEEYRPRGVKCTVDKHGFQMQHTVTINVGFLVDVPHTAMQGFCVYHKNRLVRPWWKVYHGETVGRGVVGFLDLDFVSPTPSWEDFHPSHAFLKLEAFLKRCVAAYWKKYSQAIARLPFHPDGDAPQIVDPSSLQPARKHQQADFMSTIPFSPHHPLRKASSLTVPSTPPIKRTQRLPSSSPYSYIIPELNRPTAPHANMPGEIYMPQPNDDSWEGASPTPCTRLHPSMSVWQGAALQQYCHQRGEQGGAPGQYRVPTQHGSPQPGRAPGQYCVPTQHGSPQQGRAPGQYRVPTQHGSPQQGRAPGQYRVPTQHGSPQQGPHNWEAFQAAAPNWAPPGLPMPLTLPASGAMVTAMRPGHGSPPPAAVEACLPKELFPGESASGEGAGHDEQDMLGSAAAQEQHARKKPCLCSVRSERCAPPTKHWGLQQDTPAPPFASVSEGGVAGNDMSCAQQVLDMLQQGHWSEWWGEAAAEQEGVEGSPNAVLGCGQKNQCGYTHSNATAHVRAMEEQPALYLADAVTKPEMRLEGMRLMKEDTDRIGRPVTLHPWTLGGAREMCPEEPGPKRQRAQC